MIAPASSDPESGYWLIRKGLMRTGYHGEGMFPEMKQYRKSVSGQILSAFSRRRTVPPSREERPFDPSFKHKSLMCRPTHAGLAVSAAHSAGHRAGRVLFHRRAPSFFHWLRHFQHKGRDSGSNCFRQPSDWLRMVALGVVLVDFALLSLVNKFFDRNFEGYLPGLGSILGGLLFAIIILRLARPALYPDWIAIGVFQAAMGCVVSIDPELRSVGAFLIVCSILLALSGLRLRIGEAIRPRRGAASLLACGCTTLSFILWLIVDHFFQLGTGPDTVLAADLLVAGFTTISFGLSLRSEKNCR